MPTLRFTNLTDAENQLAISSPGVVKQAVLTSKLATAERFVERFTRRRFAPEPALADPTTGYERWVLAISTLQQIPQATGQLQLHFGASASAWLTLPLDAPTLQGALQAMGAVGIGNIACSGGPLPTYPISMTFAGTLAGERGDWTVDGSGLGASSWATLTDCGFDSLPPVMKRFTTRGETTVRVPDLRVVESSSDPRIPGISGISLYGQRLLPNQYYLGFQSYAAGGADEGIGDSGAEPATHITLGYGYGTGYSLAGQFGFVQPVGYASNDLAIVGRWGWNPVPDDIVDAAYTVAARLYNERNAAFSDQMITQEGVIFQFFKQLPASTQAALETYRVPNVALIGR